MADIAARSQQNIHGNGIGYRPDSNKTSARITMTKEIVKTGETTARVIFGVVIKTNNEYTPVGDRRVLTYELWIDGTRRATSVLKSATQTMNASGSYTRWLVADNVPLDHRTTQPAYIRLVNSLDSHWTFRTDTQGGNEVVGLPIGIQRSTFSKFSSFTLLNGVTEFDVTISRISSGVTHDVSLWHGGNKITEWTGQGNLTKLSLTQAQSQVLLNRIKTSTTATVELRVQTVHGGTALYTQSRTATATVGVSPSIGAVGISDSSGALAAVGALVQNVSDITLSITNQTAGYGATINTYGYEWAGRNYSNQESSTLKAGIIQQSGSLTYTGRMSNSRGQVARRSRTDTVLPWSPPRSTSIKIERCLANGTVDPAGTSVLLSGAHSVSALAVGGSNKNTLRVQLRYRLANTSTWTSLLNKTYPAGTIYTNETHVLGGGIFDPTKTYDVEVIAADRFASALASDIIPTEKVLVSYVDNDTVGFGKIGERGIIDANGDVFVDGDLDVTGDVLGGRIKAPNLTEIVAYSMVTSNAATNIDMTLPSGFYKIYGHCGSFMDGTRAAYEALFSINGGQPYFTTLRDSTWLNVSFSGSRVTVSQISYAWHVAIIRLSP